MNPSYTFKARINKAGINPYVSVPYRITGKLKALRGYISVRGTIDGFDFQQTLCPVKDSQHRLYVNGPMLKDSGRAVGDLALFTIAQDDVPKTTPPKMLPEFKKKLMANGLMKAYQDLIPSRQKEILKYMDRLKSHEARIRNLDKVIGQLKKNNGSSK